MQANCELGHTFKLRIYINNGEYMFEIIEVSYQ